MLIIVMEEKLMPVYNGNSIEEAIGNGLNDLQLSYDNVTINILSDVLENNLGEVIRQAEVEVKKK
jgi:predicted RNA-binding protein Jag